MFCNDSSGKRSTVICRPLRLDYWPSEPRFKTATLPAPTPAANNFVGIWHGQRNMTPFTSYPIAAMEKRSVDDYAATDPSAKDDGKDTLGASCSSVSCFAEREAIGVILEPDRSPKCRGEVASERVAVKYSRVAVSHEPSGWRLAARHAHAHMRPSASCMLLNVMNERRNGGQRFGVVILWSRCS
jgi:hypothetical protein